MGIAGKQSGLDSDEKNPERTLDILAKCHTVLSLALGEGDGDCVKGEETAQEDRRVALRTLCAPETGQRLRPLQSGWWCVYRAPHCLFLSLLSLLVWRDNNYIVDIF